MPKKPTTLKTKAKTAKPRKAAPAKGAKAKKSKPSPAIQTGFMWKLLEQKKEQQKQRQEPHFKKEASKSGFEPHDRGESWAKFQGHRRKVG